MVRTLVRNLTVKVMKYIRKMFVKKPFQTSVKMLIAVIFWKKRPLDMLLIERADTVETNISAESPKYYFSAYFNNKFF